jgi:hypothetical protein
VSGKSAQHPTAAVEEHKRRQSAARAGGPQDAPSCRGGRFSEQVWPCLELFC